MSLNQRFLTRTPWQIKYSVCSVFPGSCCTAYRAREPSSASNTDKLIQLQESQPRAQSGVFPPALPPKTRTRQCPSAHIQGGLGATGGYCRSRREGRRLVVSSCYEEELNRFNTEEGGGKKPKNKLKRRQRGDAGIRGSDVYLLRNSQHRKGKGELVFGLWGLVFFFWCHSR